MGDLSPFYVEMVDKLEDLGITERGAGGFGSTGK
jgi:dUTPase